MPAASDDLMHSFYPLLANAMIQADLNSVEDEGSAAIGVLPVSRCCAHHHRACSLCRPANSLAAVPSAKLGSTECTDLRQPHQAAD